MEQWIISAIAIAGVILNNRKSRYCFYLWILSNSGSMIIHAYYKMWGFAFRDLIFMGLAIEGFLLWRDESEKKE